MRKSVLILLAVFCVVLTMTGCTIVSPDVGHERVLVEKPLIFGHGGVNPEPVRTGLTFVAFTTTAIDVNMQPVQYEERFVDLMSSDGVPLDFDTTIALQVTDSVDVIKRFGSEWYQNNVEREFANTVRQAVRTHGMNEMAISTTAIDDVDAQVFNHLSEYLKQINMPVKLLRVTVGRANPPDSVKNQRIETAQQEQRVQTEQQTKLAEDARRAAEQSRAEADNAYRNAIGLNPEQFLELQRINMELKVCGTGGGHCTFIVNGSKSQPILDARQ
jgi:regulator of protease activity HflC (stomatin/prohibitin superfamily)